MTRDQARAKAHALWGTSGAEPGDRAGFVVVRRKNVADRFEVGYYTRGKRAPSGMLLSHDWTVMGKGASWEEAFDHASRAERKPSTKKHVGQAAADYRPTRGKIDDPLRTGADSILRAVEKGGAIRLDTLRELLGLLEDKTDYHFHVEVAILPSGSAIMKTIDNERDALETIRRLKEKT